MWYIKTDPGKLPPCARDGPVGIRELATTPILGLVRDGCPLWESILSPSAEADEHICEYQTLTND
jgi:hypothetical protein